ncbi:unnamed protein product [Urochloa humidicola]
MEKRWRKRKAHAKARADQGEDSVGCCAFRRIGASESHPWQPHPGQESFLVGAMAGKEAMHVSPCYIQRLVGS